MALITKESVFPRSPTSSTSSAAASQTSDTSGDGIDIALGVGVIFGIPLVVISLILLAVYLVWYHRRKQMRLVASMAIKPGEVGYGREGHGADALPLLPTAATPWTEDSVNTRTSRYSSDVPLITIGAGAGSREEEAVAVEANRRRKGELERRQQPSEPAGWQTKPPLPGLDQSSRNSISNPNFNPVLYQNQGQGQNANANTNGHPNENENAPPPATNSGGIHSRAPASEVSSDSPIVGAAVLDGLDGAARIAGVGAGAGGRVRALHGPPIYSSEREAEQKELEEETEFGDTLPTYQSEYGRSVSAPLPSSNNLRDRGSPSRLLSNSNSALNSDPNANDHVHAQDEAEREFNDAVGIWARANRYLISPDLERRLRLAGYTPDYNPDEMGGDVWRNEYGVSPFELETLKTLYETRIQLRNQSLHQRHQSQPQPQPELQPQQLIPNPAPNPKAAI